MARAADSCFQSKHHCMFVSMARDVIQPTGLETSCQFHIRCRLASRRSQDSCDHAGLVKRFLGQEPFALAEQTGAICRSKSTY